MPEGKITQWMRRGRAVRDVIAKAGTTPDDLTAEDYATLALHDQLEEARHKCIAFYVKAIKQGAAHDWRAAAWWLDKQAREFFGDEKASHDAASPINKPQVHIYLPDNKRQITP